jgi:hypothetical protein
MNLLPFVIVLWIAAAGTTFALVLERNIKPQPYLVSYMSKTAGGGWVVGSLTVSIRVSDATLDGLREKCAEQLMEANAADGEPAPVGKTVLLSITRL